MYEFNWKAKNRFGQKQVGVKIATSATVLKEILKKQQFTNIKVSRNFQLSRRLKNSDISQVFTQLSMLLNASISLKPALQMIIENCTNLAVYKWLQQIIAGVDAGFQFSETLIKNKTPLANSEIHILKIGEASGSLAEMLDKLVNLRQANQTLRQRIIKILFYPSLVLGLAILMTLAMLLFIVPKFGALYAKKSQDLPVITEILLNIANFLQQNWGILLGFSIFVIALLVTLQRKTLFFPRFIFSTLCKMPIIAPMLFYARIVSFFDNLSVMLEAKLRLDVALKTFISPKSLDLILQREIKNLIYCIEQGYGFAQNLNPNVFSNEATQMLFAAEQSGKLDEMTTKLAQIFRRKLDYRIDLLSQSIEPIVMLVLGLIVGLVLIGLYMPIFDLGGVIA